MTRNGKIARLPRTIREELNRRMDDGETAETMLRWLNQLPEVKSAMTAQFAGAAINKQNLSEWRLGGHQDWLRHRQACEFLSQVRERAEDLDEEAGGEPISDRLASVLSAELAAIAQLMMAEAANPAERWQRLQELLGQLARLRRGDHRAMRLREQRRVQERAELAELAEQEKAEEERKAQAPVAALLLTDTMRMIQELREEQWEEKAMKRARMSATEPKDGPAGHSGQGKSDPVKPSHSESNQKMNERPGQTANGMAGGPVSNDECRTKKEVAAANPTESP